MTVVGLLTDFGLGRWLGHRAHEPMAKLLIVKLAQWATFGVLMMYWILPPLVEQLRADQMPRNSWSQLMLIRWGRVIVSGLIVGAVILIAEGLTSLVWR